MTEPNISPLAKRLAEENNVDWRRLDGSGAEGKVVERDVLDYLARVMAGDEDIDPTPEPLPDGVASWDEVEAVGSTAAVSQGAASAGREGRGQDLGEVQRDLAASRRAPDAAPAEAPSDEASEASPEIDLPDDEDEISEDIFLFDDDDAPEETDDERAGVAADSEAGAAEGFDVKDTIEDDGLLLGDPGEDVPSDEPTEDAAAAAGAGPDVLADDFLLDEPVDDTDDDDGAEAGAPASGYETERVAEHDEIDPLLSGEFEIPDYDDDDSPDLFLAGDDADEIDAEVEDETDEDAADALLLGDDLEIPESATTDDAGEDDAAVVDARIDAGDADDVETDDVETDEALADVDVVGSAATEAPERPEPDSDLDSDAAAEAETAAAPLEPVAAEVAAVDEAGPVPAETGTDAAPAPEPGVVASTAGAETDALQLGALPLVSYGNLLRRHHDLSALADAQLAVARELGEDDPIAPAAFLLRAAAKALAAEPFGDGGDVATVVASGSFGIRSVPDAHRRPFVELLELTREGDDLVTSVPDAALVVADLSALEIDEAILDVGAPLLTLGRILYDNQRGSYRSTLSLSGDVPPDMGARFLARVAELLDAPVRLVI